MGSHTFTILWTAKCHTQSDSLYVPKARINVFKQSFQYTAPSIYNALPNVIKESTTLSCFKSQLKVHAINS